MSIVPDPSYNTFIGLLQRSNDVLPTLQPSSIFNAATHYLASLPIEFLTSLSHTIVTSPSLWQDVTTREARLHGFAEAFYSATALKYSATENIHGDGFLSKRFIRNDMNVWLKHIVEGSSVPAAHFDVRLAIFTGLLRGIREQKNLDDISSGKKTEDELTLACLEATAEHSPQEWVEQFGIHGISSPITVPSNLQLLSQALQLLPGRKVRLLDLERIIKHVMDKISTCFQQGYFLRDLGESIATTSDETLVIRKTSPFATSIDRVSSSPIFSVIGPSSTLIASCVTNLPESSSKNTTWAGFEELVAILESQASTIAGAWAQSSLADVTKDEQLAPDSRDITTKLWTIFKSILFSNIIIFQPILDLMLFNQPPSRSHTGTNHSARILTTFFELSFITSKLGPGSGAQGGAFVEQRKAFFTALDILGYHADDAASWLESIATKIKTSPSPSRTVHRSKTSFLLISAEQLMPVLDEQLIEELILPVAQLYLTDPSERETFESAHSFVLSIFSSHSKIEDERNPGSGHSKDKIAGRLAPYYLDCLISCSGEGGLSTEQLCLAYSSLVSSARHLDIALAQLCIDKLWNCMDTAASDSPIGIQQSSQEEHTHRLCLALISAISAASSTLLPDLLSRIQSTIRSEHDVKRRKELLSAAFRQVSTGAADADREIVMRWWLELHDEMKHSGLTDERENPELDLVDASSS